MSGLGRKRWSQGGGSTEFQGRWLSQVTLGMGAKARASGQHVPFRPSMHAADLKFGFSNH